MRKAVCSNVKNVSVSVIGPMNAKTQRPTFTDPPRPLSLRTQIYSQSTTLRLDQRDQGFMMEIKRDPLFCLTRKMKFLVTQMTLLRKKNFIKSCLSSYRRIRSLIKRNKKAVLRRLHVRHLHQMTAGQMISAVMMWVVYRVRAVAARMKKGKENTIIIDRKKQNTSQRINIMMKTQDKRE